MTWKELKAQGMVSGAVEVILCKNLTFQEINFIMNLFKYVKEFFGFVESSWKIYSELSLTTI